MALLGQVTARVLLVCCQPLLVVMLQVKQQVHGDPPATLNPQGQFGGEGLLVLQHLLQKFFRAIQQLGEILEGLLPGLEFQGQILPNGDGGTLME